MISLRTLIAITLILGIYVLMLFCMEPRIRKYMKIYVYFIVFISLLFPDFDYIVLPFQIVLDFRFYAIVISGFEIVEMCAKQILEKKLAQGKDLNKWFRRVYDSL